MSATAQTYGRRLEEPQLRSADILAARWAEETRNRAPLASNPIARAMAQAEGAALPGGDEQLSETSALIDQIVARMTPRSQQLLHVWYRTGDASDVKARRLGLSRAGLYVQWKAALWFIVGALDARGIDLRRWTHY